MSRLLVRLRVPLGFAAAVLYLVAARPTLGSLLAGGPLVAAGEAIRLWASGHVTKNRALTTSGPYAHVRHPLYLGSLLLLWGFALAARSGVLAAVLVAAFLGVYAGVIGNEERVLAERFPDRHLAYARAVRKVVPRLRPWPEADRETGFALSAAMRHREWRAVLGAVALACFLVGRWQGAW